MLEPLDDGALIPSLLKANNSGFWSRDVVFLSFLFCITPAGLNLSIPCSPPIPLFKVPGIFGLPSSS